MHVALFAPLVEVWTIVHETEVLEALLLLLPPPPDRLQLTELTPPAVAICSTRLAVVQFQPLPGHFVPA